MSQSSVIFEMYNAIKNLQARQMRASEWSICVKVLEMAVLHMSPKMIRAREQICLGSMWKLSVTKTKETLGTWTQDGENVRINDIGKINIKSTICWWNSLFAWRFM